MKERRRFVRIPDSSLITYKVISEATLGDDIAKDISQSGIRFFSNEFIPKDSILKLRASLKKISFSFESLVKVVWVVEDSRKKRYEIGAEFVDIPEEAARHLINYIKCGLEETQSE